MSADASAAAVSVVGIDLAWGERNGDGLCLIDADPSHARVTVSAHTFGDAALLEWLEQHLRVDRPALLCLDAPVVCPNATGSRPVDRLAQTLFARFHAGPHPANQARCARVLRVVELLRERLGFRVGWRLDNAENGTPARAVIEVFPHPAIVRMFELPHIVRYKRKPGRSVEFCRGEFRHLQALVRHWLPVHCPELSRSETLDELLAVPLNKPAEDRLDALICALVGYRHWRRRGGASEVIGDLETGFIVLPKVATHERATAPA